MIDIHCHILPRLDDGPQKLSESVAMARVAAADGITHIVATPHVNGNFTSLEEEALTVCFRSELNRLREKLQVEQIPIGILPGAEVAYSNLGTKILDKLGMNQTRYLLIEFPHTHLPADAGELIFSLVNDGFYPIVAHPERNRGVIDKPQKLMLLRERGALAQITADSLTDTNDQDVKQCAYYLLKKGAVEFIASDAHSSQARPPILSKAYKVVSKVVGVDKAEDMMRGNATIMLRGKALKEGL